jgi:hypothetical protein
MNWRILACAFVVAISVQPALAQGFKCSLNHVTRVGADRSYQDNVYENSNLDFFLALDEKTGKANSSVCTKLGCNNSSDALILEDNDNDANPLRSIRVLSDSGLQMWSLESYRDSTKYQAVVVSIDGQLAVSRFGECTKILQSANTAAAGNR